MSAPPLSRTPVSPAAERATRPSWRDPRLAAGIALVAACGLLGARLVGSADDTVAVWAVRADVVAGQPVTEQDLATVRIRFGSGSDADGYLSADESLPDGLVLTRDVDAGELLPRAALGSATDADLLEVPLTVPTGAVSVTLSVGDIVDVWVTGKDAQDAVRALRDVRVLAVPNDSSAFSSGADRQVVVGVGADQEADLPGALAMLATGTAVVTKHTGR